MEFIAKDKYFCMRRAYERLKKINTNNGNSISNTEAKDSTEDFFNHCYHFKDWLKKDRSISITSDIEDFINNSTSLSLAADYCNSFKHGGLDKKARSNKQLEKINTHIKFDLTPSGFIATSSLEITIDGVKYDAFSLASDCVDEWNKLLRQNNIKFSNT